MTANICFIVFFYIETVFSKYIDTKYTVGEFVGAGVGLGVGLFVGAGVGDGVGEFYIIWYLITN